MPGAKHVSPRRPQLSRRRLLTLTAAALAALTLGSEGSGAGSRPLQVRRNAKLLTRGEKARFVNAIKETKRTPSPYDAGVSVYDYWVHLHYDAYYDPNMPAHMAAAFPPWHRSMLLLYERELQQVDPEITIPYWDWTVDNQRDSYIWDDDFMGGDGDPSDNWIVKTGPFRQGEWSLTFIDPESYDQDGTIFDLQRHFAVKPSADVPTTTLPTAADVEAALSIPVFDVEPWDDTSDPTQSFRNNLEGFRWDSEGTRAPSQTHNRVHNWIAGPMSEGASPNDPVFWLHHATVDMLWAQWQARWGSPYLPVSGARYSQNLYDPLWGMGDVTAAMMLDHRALGYIYDRELKADWPGPATAAVGQALSPADYRAPLGEAFPSSGRRVDLLCDPRRSGGDRQGAG